MITVTEKAKEVLSELLRTKVDWSYARLRLLDKGEGVFGLGIDVEMPTDVQITHNGTPFLVCDTSLASRISEFTIDVEDTGNGPEIFIVDSSPTIPG